MPTPLSLRLSQRVRRLLPIIEGGVTSGLSSRAINTAIRNATGTGIRRQDLLDIIREIKGIQKHGDTLKNVRLDRRPDPRRTPNALTPISTAISSTVQIKGRLFGTAALVVQHVQVVHDSILTRGQIEDIAAAFFDEEQEEQFKSTSGIELDEVLLVEQVQRA